MSRKGVLLGLVLFINPLLLSAKIIIKNIEVEQTNSEFVKVEANVRQENDKSVIDINVDLLKDLGRSVFFKVYIEKDDNGRMKKVFNTDLVDQCHFYDYQDRYPEFNTLVEDFKKNGNMIFKPCPLLKGKYYVKGFKFAPKLDFTKLLKPGEYIVHFSFYKSESDMRQIYSIKWVANIE